MPFTVMPLSVLPFSLMPFHLLLSPFWLLSSHQIWLVECLIRPILLPFLVIEFCHRYTFIASTRERKLWPELHCVLWIYWIPVIEICMLLSWNIHKIAPLHRCFTFIIKLLLCLFSVYFCFHNLRLDKDQIKNFWKLIIKELRGFFKVRPLLNEARDTLFYFII